MDGQPFFFDNNVFDDDPLVGMNDKNMPAKPEFTRDEMEQLRQQAFQEGKKAGFKESEDGITNNLLALVKKLERDIMVLFAAEDDRNKLYEGEAVHLSLSIIQKLFPLYTENHGILELQSAIETALKKHKTPNKIKIELQDDISKSLEEYITKLEGTLQKQITLSANPSLRKEECHISWPDGGIISSRNEISEKILETMKETLADHGISVHDEKEQSHDNEEGKS